MKRLVSPKHIAAVTAVLAVLLLLAAYFETRRTSRNILEVMEADGAALIESLILSSQNSLKAEAAVLGFLADKLLDDCRVIDRYADKGRLTLFDIAVARGLAYVDIFDGGGNLIASSGDHEVIFSVDSTTVPTGKEVFLGESGGHYGFALSRTKGQGIIVCAVDASYVEYFKKDISIGSLIDSLSEKEGLVYLLLQNQGEGIIFASKNIDRMKKIEHDPFLQEALLSNVATSRHYEFQGVEVLEVVKPFFFEEEPYGIFRAGLSLDGYNAVMRGSRRQTVVVSGVLFLIGIVVFTLLALNQTFQVVNRSYTEIRSFTAAVLESMETGVVAVDSEGRVTVLNRAAKEIMKVGSSALLLPYDEVFPGDPLRLKELLSGKESKGDFETEILGSTVLVSISLLSDIDGKASGGTALLRDVTSVRRMEREMKQRERLSLLGDTAASVAHEVRNPLNAISMAAQRLEEEYAAKEGMDSAKEFSRILRQEVKRLDGIVSQFLSLARPSQLNLKKCDLNRLVTETVALAEGEAASLSIEISTSLADIPRVVLDPDEFKKAVINIVRNGLEAAGEGGTVDLSTRLDGNMVALQIEDSGKGMNEEQMSKVFQPYFTTKEQGTGLGLSIAQRVVADHGGRIDVDSTLGKGTVFTIWLNVPPEEGNL